MGHYLEVFTYLWLRQRRKTHGASKAPFGQALLFSLAGAWVATKIGPNPMGVWMRLHCEPRAQPNTTKPAMDREPEGEGT